jgi:hypothetical protein
MSLTPNYAIPFQALLDRPDGPNLGEDMAMRIDAVLRGLDSRVAQAEAQLGAAASQAGEFVCGAVSNVNSAAFGAEGVALATNTGTFPNGRVFKAIINAGYFGSVANNALIRVRKGTAGTGTVLWLMRTPPLPLVAATAQYLLEAVFMNNSGADISGQDLCVTIQASAGTVTQTAAGTSQRYIDVINWGSTDDYGTGWVGL